MNISEDKLSEIVQTSVQKVIDAKFNPLWVDRETHYNDHKFLGSIRDRVGKVVTVSCNVLVYAICGAILTLLGLGLKVWIWK